MSANPVGIVLQVLQPEVGLHMIELFTHETVEPCETAVLPFLHSPTALDTTALSEQVMDTLLCLDVLALASVWIC